MLMIEYMYGNFLPQRIKIYSIWHFSQMSNHYCIQIESKRKILTCTPIHLNIKMIASFDVYILPQTERKIEYKIRNWKKEKNSFARKMIQSRTHTVKF